MSRIPLGAGDAIYCSSRDNGGVAAVGGAVQLIVRAAYGENQSMIISPPFAPPQAARTKKSAGGGRSLPIRCIVLLDFVFSINF